jgi:hypothetical protein
MLRRFDTKPNSGGHSQLAVWISAIIGALLSVPICAVAYFAVVCFAAHTRGGCIGCTVGGLVWATQWLGLDYSVAPIIEFSFITGALAVIIFVTIGATKRI